MEIFYAQECSGGRCRFSQEESRHLVKVLRHRKGDRITVTDGAGDLCLCVLENADPRAAEARILERKAAWGGHPYRLSLGVCLPKNHDRYEWFVEKAVEIGVDEIVPLIGAHSERRTFNRERLERVMVSAMKQSLKARLPEIAGIRTVGDYVAGLREERESLKLIACCFEGEGKRVSIPEALAAYGGRSLVILIGPEGDFSPEEAAAATAAGFIPIHLGSSRLRTETAAVLAAAAVYLRHLPLTDGPVTVPTAGSVTDLPAGSVAASASGSVAASSAGSVADLPNGFVADSPAGLTDAPDILFAALTAAPSAAPAEEIFPDNS